MTGAKQPNYLVTADDVDSYLAIEVQPLDDRKRKVNCVDLWCFPNLLVCEHVLVFSFLFLHLSMLLKTYS